MKKIILSNNKRKNESIIKKIDVDLGKITNASEIKTGVYLIEINNKRWFIIKLSRRYRMNRSLIIKRKVYDSVMNYEINVNLSLLKKRFKFLKYPKLIEYKYNEYMIFEFFESVNKHEVDKGKDLIMPLVEFQNSKLNITQSISQKLFFSSFTNHITFIRNCMKSFLPKNGLKLTIRAIKTYFKCLSKVSKLHYNFILHNDLKENTLFLQEGPLSFIDFEGVKKERKLILEDIISWSFNLDNHQINRQLFEEYIKYIIENKMITRKRLKIKHQLRAILIRSYIRSLYSPTVTNEQKNRRNLFLINVLLPDESYNMWYKKELE